MKRESILNEIRAAGVDARWYFSKRGPRIIFRAPQHRGWFVVTGQITRRAQIVGWGEAIAEFAALAHMFSVGAEK